MTAPPKRLHAPITVARLASSWTTHRDRAGTDDALPAEPGGYAGYTGLFGSQNAEPLLTGQPSGGRRGYLIKVPV